MLWRRYHAQTEASGEAEGRQETDARIRPGKHSAGGFHRRAAHGRRKLLRNPVADREFPLRPCNNKGSKVQRFKAMQGAAATHHNDKAMVEKRGIQQMRDLVD